MKSEFVDGEPAGIVNSPASSIYSILNSVNIPVCVIDTDGKLIYLNKSFKDLFLSESNPAVKQFSSHFIQEYEKRISGTFSKVQDGQQRNCFAVMKTVEEMNIPVEVHFYPLVENSSVNSVLAFIVTVDESMMSFDKSSFQFADGEIQYGQNIYEFSPFPILRIDRNFAVIRGSASIKGLFGFNVKEIIDKGNDFLSEFFPRDSIDISGAIEDIFDGDVSFKRIGDVLVSMNIDEEKWVNMIMYPILSGNQIESVEIILENITSLKQLERKLGFINRVQIVGDLAKGLLHSFSNIINIIMSRTQLLLQLTEKEQVVDGLKVIDRTATEGVKQIRRIQKFITDKDSLYDMDEENLIEVIEDAIEFAKLHFKVESKEKRRKIRIERKYFTLMNVRTDSRLLREVFMSMIFKVSSVLMKEGIINVILRDNGDPVLSVTAHKPETPGKGDSSGEFSEDSLNEQVDIRRLADRLNIKIIEEESSDMYSIKAVLPQGIVNRIKKEEDDEEDYRLRDLDVIIVEDEKELREILSEMFDHLGNRVYLFENGETALSEFKKGKYDVLITDYGLSGITGLELLVRAKEIDEKVITVLLTGWTLNDVGDISAYRNVVNLFYQKPFKLEVLIKGISRIIRLEE